MKTHEIRSAFLDYFSEKNHQIVTSSSLVPKDDLTLLFTNAGMVQFKGCLLGSDKRSYTRATSSQRCVRAGGKHNDLDNVGYTARHHTFFEMLGNFSFGDYFKREAIEFSWDFLTNILKLPAEKLWVTVYKDDKEAEKIWLEEVKIDSTRFSRCGDEDNFWAMGDTGPCGPCSEIFYDHGPEIPGGPPGSPEADLDRYIEIWNLVFMQYNRNKSGALSPLPKPSIDTGMGLERIAAVMQQVHNNYDIDLFQILKKAIQSKITIKDYADASVNVMADHIRSCAFLILDGVLPSNEGRGYVLRRIIRRAVRHGAKLGLESPAFYQLLPALIEAMGDAYPELLTQQSFIAAVLKQEEVQFSLTLKNGMKLLQEAIQALPENETTLSGEIVFKLYDTYGFPADLTQDVLREHNLKLDWPGFEKAMLKQREQSKSDQAFASNYLENLSVKSEFIGYEQLNCTAKIVALFEDQKQQSTLSTLGANCKIVLDQTPFYAESGGQVGDIGEIVSDGLKVVITDTQKQDQAIIHFGRLELGTLAVGSIIQATVKTASRVATRLNHSATHLLHAALQNILGAHVQQKGSLVDADRLRFDFSHPEALTSTQRQTLEYCVNEKIRENLAVTTEITTPEIAKSKGAMALFGEKYGDKVRVLRMGDFSCELCGGTHVERTGDIGLFKIISEEAVASGVRRIEALTGQAALQWCLNLETQIIKAAEPLKMSLTQIDILPTKIESLIDKQKQLERTNQTFQDKLTHYDALLLLEKAETVSGIKLLIHSDKNLAAKSIRGLLDSLKDKLAPAIIILVAESADKINVVASLSDPKLIKFSPKEMIQFLCGKGGGRADFAQGGSVKPHNLPEKLNELKQILINHLDDL